jgi:hypothetical protein
MSSRARPTRALWAMIHRVGIRNLPDGDSSVATQIPLDSTRRLLKLQSE